MRPPPEFPALDRLATRLAEALQPPDWVVHETQRRVVLFLNHVLQQEPQAQARLVRQQGRIAEVRWRHIHMRLVVTPAGLLDLAAGDPVPDLTLTLTQDSPFGLGQALMRGDKPQVRIAGDVQFAAEINWLVDHVRWDVEEDLSRVFGDAPAHAIVGVGSALAGALRRFAGAVSGPVSGGADAAGRDAVTPPPTPPGPGR